MIHDDTRTIWRRARSLLALIPIAFILGCDSTGPSLQPDGNYVLVAIEGEPLPYVHDTPDCDITYSDGTVRLWRDENGRWFERITDADFRCSTGESGS